MNRPPAIEGAADSFDESGICQIQTVADVSFVAGEVPMIIDAVGLKGHDDHTPGETADLSTLPVQTKRAAVLLARIAQGQK